MPRTVCLFLLCLIIVLLAGGIAPAGASAVHSPIAGYEAFRRPDPEGVPTEVLVGLYLIDIADISDVDRRITLDFVLSLKWSDPRLADTVQGVDRPLRRFRVEDVWHPDVVVLNE